MASGKKTKPLYKKILLPFLGVLILGLLVASFWPKPVALEIAVVQRGPLTVSVFEEGKTRIRHRYTISPPTGGMLERITLRAGDRVNAGETVLAVIRPEPSGFLDPRARAQAEATVQAAKAALLLRGAELARSLATLNLAEKDFARFDALRASQAISAQQWDLAQNLVQVRRREVGAARSAQAMAEFEVLRAEAALLQASDPDTGAEVKSQPLRLRAPVDGVVLQVFEESARPVTSGLPLLEIGDPSDLEAEIELLSTDAVGVQVGAAVSVEQWGGDHVLRGRVSQVERGGFTKISALGVEEQRVLVRVDFVDPKQAQALGDRFRVEARIVVWQGDSILQVPVGALFRYGNNWMTFVLRAGKAQRQQVNIGHNNGLAAEVLDGLQEGDQVILYPPDTLSEGDAVHSLQHEGR